MILNLFNQQLCHVTLSINLVYIHTNSKGCLDGGKGIEGNKGEIGTKKAGDQGKRIRGESSFTFYTERNNPSNIGQIQKKNILIFHLLPFPPFTFLLKLLSKHSVSIWRILRRTFSIKCQRKLFQPLSENSHSFHLYQLRQLRFTHTKLESLTYTSNTLCPIKCSQILV